MNRTHSECINFLKYALPLIILGVFLIGYWPVFQKMLIRWGGGDNNYCYLIVPLFLYLLWDMRKDNKEKRKVKSEKSEKHKTEEDVKDYGLRDKDYELKGKDYGLGIKDQGSKQKVKTDLPQTSSEAVLKPQSTGSFRFGEFSWSMLGLVPVVFSVLLILVGELGSVETLLYTGIWGCAFGMILVLYGRRIRELIFPILILLFIVPLPPFVNRILTFKLKLAASKLSVAMLRISGVSVLREGNVIDLGISQLQVVDACSGLRYLIPLFLMALLVGYFFNKRSWHRLVLVLVVLPLYVFVNAVRIWITGLLTEKGYEKLAQSFFHDFSGWLIFIMAGAVLLAVSLVLRNCGNREEKRGKSKGHGLRSKDQGSRIRSQKPEAVDQRSDLRLNEKTHLTNQPFDHSTNWKKPVLITVVLCLLFAGSGWALKVIPSAKNLPNRRTFDSFPMQIGQWQGQRNFISKEILNELWSDDYVSVTYSRQGLANTINLLIPFYEYQGTRHTAHAPQSCMLGGGWALFNTSERLININSHEQIKIMTTIWKKEDYKLLGSYFFFQRGRVIISPWMNKFYLMWDAFTKRRTDGALVRVELVMAPGQSMDDVYEVLEGFIAKLWPILPEYIPE